MALFPLPPATFPRRAPDPSPPPRCSAHRPAARREGKRPETTVPRSPSEGGLRRGRHRPAARRPTGAGRGGGGVRREVGGSPAGRKGLRRGAPRRAPRGGASPRGGEPIAGRAARGPPNGKARGRRCQAAVRDDSAAGRKRRGRARGGTERGGGSARAARDPRRRPAERGAAAPALWAGGPAAAQRGCPRWRPASRRQRRARHRHRRGRGRRCGRPAERRGAVRCSPAGPPAAGPWPSAAATP